MPPYAHQPRTRPDDDHPDHPLPGLWEFNRIYHPRGFRSVAFASWVESWEWWTSMLPRARFYAVGLRIHKRIGDRRQDRRYRWRQLRLAPS